MINYATGLNWELVVNTASGFELKRRTSIEGYCQDNFNIYFYGKDKVVEFKAENSHIISVDRGNEEFIAINCRTCKIMLASNGEKESGMLLKSFIDNLEEQIKGYIRMTRDNQTEADIKKININESIHAFLQTYHRKT